MSVLLEFSHFNSINSTFITLVAQFATATVLCLLQVVCSQESVNDRNLLCGIETGNSLGYSLADIIEVRSFTTNYASQDNNCVIAAIKYHLMCTIDKLETSRNSLNMYVLC